MRSNIYLLIPLFLCTSADDEKLRNCHVTHMSNYSTPIGIARWASICTQLRNSEFMSQKSSAVITLCKTLLHLFLKLGYHESRTGNADCITVEAVGRNSLICLNNVYVKWLCSQRAVFGTKSIPLAHSLFDEQVPHQTKIRSFPPSWYSDSHFLLT